MKHKASNWSSKTFILTLSALLLLPSISSAEIDKSPHSHEPKSYLTTIDKTSHQRVTVIVELQEDPIKVHESKAINGLTTYSSTHNQQVMNEQHTFKQALTQTSDARIEHEFARVFNGFSVSLPQNEVDQLLHLPHVKAIYPNEKFKETPLTLTLASAPASTVSHDIIGTTALWNLGYKGKGIRVGVIDSGVDYRHPSLRDAYKGGYDFVDNDNDPMETAPRPDLSPDENAKYATVHGTFVAGVLVGRGHPNDANSNKGTVRGVAPEADLYAYRVLGPYKEGTTEDIVAAIERAVADDMDIINLSLSGDSNTQYTADTVALNNAAMAGVIAVTSNGNRGPNEYSVTHPTGAHQAISAGASTSNRIDQQQVAAFSSRGPSLPDYEIKPDVVAPGTRIRSTVPAWDGNYSDAYKITNGTSMAAPHVAGAAALLLNKAEVEGKYFEPGEIKAILMNNAVQLYDASDNLYRVHDQGAGRIDIPRTLQAEATALVKATTDVTKNMKLDEYFTGSLSFGQVTSGATLHRELLIKDIVDKDQSYTLSIHFDENAPVPIELTASQSVINLRAGEEVPLKLRLHIPTSVTTGSYYGHISIQETTSKHTLRVPFSLHIGDRFTLPPVFSLKMTPGSLLNMQQTAHVEYSILAPVEQFDLTVQHAVYGDMGSITTRNGVTPRGHYELPKWDGTVVKDGKQLLLPDGNYSIIPKIGKQPIPITQSAIQITINRTPAAVRPSNL